MVDQTSSCSAQVIAGQADRCLEDRRRHPFPCPSTGADRLVFDGASSPSAADRLIDLEVGVDMVVISRAAFGIGSGIVPALIANAAPVASGPGGVLLYDNAGGGAGGLGWDASGAEAVRIARLSNAAPLSAGDVLLIA